MSSTPDFSIPDQQDRRILGVLFPHAPLVRLRCKPSSRDGVVLDKWAVLTLIDELETLVERIEEREGG